MQKRILVVDDEAVVRKSFQRIFAGTDIEVATVLWGTLRWMRSTTRDQGGHRAAVRCATSTTVTP